MRIAILTATTLILSACVSPEPVSETDLPFLGDGYRANGDQCRQIGEDDFTNQFLDDAADLVGCPEGMENLGVFIIETAAVEVDRKDSFILFSVPLR